MSDPISTIGIAELRRQLVLLETAVAENTRQIADIIGILQRFMKTGATENTENGKEKDNEGDGRHAE